MDYESFLDRQKALLVAPAGYGKTYTIVECLKYTSGRQLILTHTHAGVASIKSKIRKAMISSDRYSVETISSFSQKYVKAFYVGSDIPEQDAKNKTNPDKDYHSFIQLKTCELLLSQVIKQIIQASYDGLFVDEYQDCTQIQQKLIMKLADILPTRLLGDPLQGVFDFNGPVPDFTNDLSEFDKFPELKIPYRWYQEGNNKELGKLIKNFRSPLTKGQTINVRTQAKSGLYVIKIKEDDFNDAQSLYRKKIEGLLSYSEEDSSYKNLLLLVPEYTELDGDQKKRKGGVSERAKILSKIDYSNSITLLEAIDDKKFYSLAKDLDDLVISIKRARKPVKKIYDLLSNLFYKTGGTRHKNKGLNDWISSPSPKRAIDYYVKTKRSDPQGFADSLKTIIEEMQKNPSKRSLYSLVLFVKNDLRIRVQPRTELLNSLIKAIHDSINTKTTIFEAMKSHKNIIRRVGKKIHGKCIGTTLLTKGLEFDTVAILDAHKFDCPKHLYVALTRCCKNLIIFTSQPTLPAKVKCKTCQYKCVYAQL